MAGRTATWVVTLGAVSAFGVACGNSSNNGAGSDDIGAGGAGSGGVATSSGGVATSSGGASTSAGGTEAMSTGGVATSAGGVSTSAGGSAGGVATSTGGVATSTGGTASTGGASGEQQCPSPPSGITATQSTAISDVNAVRLLAGAGCATMVTTINTSAEDHCEYVSANTGACVADPHTEVAGCTDFVAADFGDRMKHAGYTGQPAFEVMAGQDDPTSAIQEWIDSVWHRLPLLDPWITDLGYGNAPKCDTIDFGNGTPGASSLVVFYPYANQTGVPTSFDGRTEGPTPPAPPGGWPSGYPITVYAKGINVTAHSITKQGDATVLPDIFLTSKDSEFLNDDIIVYPDSPLAGGTTYRVQMTGTSSNGALDLDWTFTTK